MTDKLEVELTERLDRSLAKIAEIVRKKYHHNVVGHMQSGLWPNGSIKAFMPAELPYLQIEGSADRTGSTWHRRYTGKLRIQVGDYGNRYNRRKQFPEPKAGFDHERIAAFIADYIQRAIDSDAHRKQIRDMNEKSKSAATKIEKRVGSNTRLGLFLSAGTSLTEVKVRVKLNTELSPEKAEKLAAGLKTLLEDI